MYWSVLSSFKICEKKLSIKCVWRRSSKSGRDVVEDRGLGVKGTRDAGGACLNTLNDTISSDKGYQVE